MASTAPDRISFRRLWATAAHFLSISDSGGFGLRRSESTTIARSSTGKDSASLIRFLTSKLILRDIERAVENAQDVDVSIVLHEVCDAVMPIEQNSDVSLRNKVPVPNFWVTGENLRPLINPLDSTRGGFRVVQGDVLEDILEPTLGFFGPRYCCRERMRRPISSFETVRFASESARPRSTMT